MSKKRSPPGDTSLGGAEQSFPETVRDLIEGIHRGPGPHLQVALEQLCRLYWKPVYRYIRIAWARSNEDAKDLTQGFFAWLMEGDALRKYEAARGGFRTYLKVLLAGYVGDQRKADTRLKRGGGVTILPLDDPDLLSEPDVPESRGMSPEEWFDREWAKTLARRAIDRVRRRYENEGRESRFRIFETCDLSPGGEKPTYKEVAERLSLKATDVRNRLAEVRESVRTEIRKELSSTLSDQGLLEEEWNALFGS